MSQVKRRAQVARRPQTTRRQFLQMEQLEERAVLAGNVTAYDIAGYLTLYGDSQSNELKLTRVGTSAVQITPLAGTRINGSTAPLTIANVTGGLTAFMGDGNDVLELSGSTTTNFRVSGFTTISTGSGNDTVRFVNYSSSAGLFLDTGTGDDTVTAALDPLAPTITTGGLRVNGPAIISTSLGNDYVSLRNSAFNKTFRIDTSLDNDTVDIRNTEIRSVSVIYDPLGVDSLNNAGNTFSTIFPPFIYGFETKTSFNGPTAGNDTATVAEGGDATITVLANDTANGSPLNPASVAIVTPPTRGTAVVNANGTITYTNAGDEFLADSLTYTVKDAAGNTSNTATVAITITPVNDLPVAVADAFTVNEGATTTLNLGQNDTDAENRLNLGSIVITQQPASGTVTVGTDGNVTYVGNATELTTDTFQYTIADLDTGVSLPGTVTLTITQVNNPPTIAAIADWATDEDTATGSIAVTIGDAETAATALTVAATSDNTTLLPPGSFVFGGSDTARTLVITPAANQFGTATVTVTVTDGDNATTTETFVLTVNAQNDAPTISGATDVTTNEDIASTAMTVNVGDIETPDGLTVTATASSDPAVVALGGVAITGSGATRQIVVTPVANAFGTSTITLTVSDGTDTATQTFVVTVDSVNDDPTLAVIDDVTAAVGTTIPAVIATGSDLETAAASLTYTATSDNVAVVTDAGLVFTNNSLQISPVAAATGIANITVRVTDADGGFAEQVFTLTIDSPPTISEIVDQAIDVDTSTGALMFTVGDAETAAADLTLSATSSDETLVPLSNIEFGGTGANRAVTVSPAAGLSGSSTIRVTVTDASGLTAFEEFVVTVGTVNTLPTISTIADISQDEDVAIAPFDITIGDAETAVDDLIVSISSDNELVVANSGLSISTTGATRTVTVAQVPNASGTANITVTVDDGDGGVTTETFTVSIQALPDAPTAGAAAGTVDEGGSVSIDLGAVSSDPEDDLDLTGIVITNQPANGNVVPNGDGTVTYTHDGSETLTDSFTYTIADALGNVSNEATVTVTITPVNDAPDAVDDIATATVVSGAVDPIVITGNLLTNDTDSDSLLASLAISALSQGTVGEVIELTYGDLTINADGSWTYTIDPADVDAIINATDPEEFLTYTLSDGELTDTATFTIDFNISPT